MMAVFYLIMSVALVAALMQFASFGFQQWLLIEALCS